MTMSPSLNNFITTLQHSTEKVPKKVTSKINEIARKAIKEMSKEAGKFLHEDLDDDAHTEAQVKAIIELFPDSLSQVGKHGNLPIQTATRSGAVSSARSSVTFIPLMAREGCRLGVGGEGKRGGLLSAVPGINRSRMNTIQVLTFTRKGDDIKRTHVLENLRDMNLLKKVDVEEYGLLAGGDIFYSDCQQRFEFFSNLDPDTLGARDSQWTTPIHLALHWCDNAKEGFERTLKAGMKHFPERLGFLFLKQKGITACKRAFDKLGVDTAMNIIRRCIPPSDSNLILHRAFRHEPNLVDDFARFYPDAAFLRDANGHTFSQVKYYTLLRKGERTFEKQSLFFIEATDDQLSTVDPKTGLCPFMLAAAGNKSDLTAVYYLLKKHPKLVESGSHENDVGTDSDEVKNSRKRQREDISTLSI